MRDSRRPDELPQHDPQRVGVAKLIVAEGRQHQGANRIDPTTKQSKDIERRLIGPMQILEHEHRRPTSCHLFGEHGHHLVRKTATIHEFLELATAELRHIDKRSECTRREQALTRAP